MNGKNVFTDPAGIFLSIGSTDSGAQMIGSPLLTTGRAGLAGVCLAALLVAGCGSVRAQETAPEAALPLRGAVDDLPTDDAAVEVEDGGTARRQPPLPQPVRPPAPQRLRRPEAIPAPGILATEVPRLEAGAGIPVEADPLARDPLETKGMRVGGFILRPSLEVDGAYSDNVNQKETDRVSASGLRVAPSLRLRSNWVRHELSVAANGEFIAWDNGGGEDATLSASARLRVDVRRTTQAIAEASYELGEEDAPSKRLQHDLRLKGSLAQEMGRVRVEASAGAGRTFYTAPLSGGSSGADDDYTVPEVSLRVSKQSGSILRPYLELGADMRIHDRRRDGAGVERDSKGAYLEAGIGFSPSVIWSGYLGLRAVVRDYDDPSLQSVLGAGLVGELRWRPTRLTEVRLQSAFDIDETTAAGVSGVRKYRLSLTPRHALRRNVIIKGTLGLEYSDYVGSTDHELVLTGGMEIAWRFWREHELVAAYSVERQWSTLADGDYLENRIMLGLRFRI